MCFSSQFVCVCVFCLLGCMLLLFGFLGAHCWGFYCWVWCHVVVLLDTMLSPSSLLLLHHQLTVGCSRRGRVLTSYVFLVTNFAAIRVDKFAEYVEATSKVFKFVTRHGRGRAARGRVTVRVNQCLLARRQRQHTSAAYKHTRGRPSHWSQLPVTSSYCSKKRTR